MTAKRQEVANVEKMPLAPSQSAQSEAGAFLAAVLRASGDPSVDIVKTREMMAMYRELVAEQKEQAFNEAMAAAQKEMRRIATDKDNSQTKSRYASYAALDRAIRPIYTEHGFSLSFDTEPVEQENTLRVICYVSAAGHTRKYKIDMPADGKGAKGGDVMTKTHATGSAASYARRYLAMMIFNLAIGEDDDGNAASGEAVSQEQVEKLQTLIVQVGADIARFCKYMGVARIDEIPAKQFNRAVSALEAKRAKA